VFSAIQDFRLVFIPSKDSAPIRSQVVGFTVEKDNAQPVTYPAVPKNAQVFIESNAGFRRFDLATGIPSGPFITAPIWEG
jgi:hypothetical protein